MTVYRQIFGSDAWHFMKSCSQWPGNGFNQIILKPGLRPQGGELCDECLAKEKAAKAPKKGRRARE